MPQNLLISLLPFIALILAGLSVAALWYWWISTKDDEPEESAGQPIGEPASRAELSAEPPAAKPVLTSVSAPPASAAQPVFEGEAIEVMRILRDLADGSLIVEIDGRRYRSLNEIVDPQVGRRFMGNAQALADFAVKLGKDSRAGGVGQVPTPERPAASAPQPWPTRLRRPPPPPPEPAAPRRGGLFRRAQAEDEQPGAAAHRRADRRTAPIPASQTPELAHRSIHIRPQSMAASHRGRRAHLRGNW